MKKTRYILLFIVSVFFFKSTFGQVIDTPIEHYVVNKEPKVKPEFSVSGRILGVNLEDVTGADVINMCSADKSKTDNRGIFHISASAGDTLAVLTPKYSAGLRCVKSAKENLNIILIKRKTDLLPPGYTRSNFNKARKDDEELLRILEKDAKLEAKWKY